MNKPDSAISDKATSGHESVSHRRSTIRFVVMASVYAFWLLWLAYIAWVNVQAGNQ